MFCRFCLPKMIPFGSAEVLLLCRAFVCFFCVAGNSCIRLSYTFFHCLLCGFPWFYMRKVQHSIELFFPPSVAYNHQVIMEKKGYYVRYVLVHTFCLCVFGFLVVLGFWRLGCKGIGYSASLDVLDFVLTVVVGSLSEI